MLVCKLSLLALLGNTNIDICLRVQKIKTIHDKNFLIPILSCRPAVLATPAACSPTRNALGGLLGTITRPIIDFKNGILNLFKPRRAPKQNFYQAPAPTYYIMPAPVTTYYHFKPAPVLVTAAPPIYTTVGEVRGSPPPLKPEIPILPVPDLSIDAPAPDLSTNRTSELREPEEFVGSPAINLIKVETENSPEVIIELTDEEEKEDITTERAEAVVTTTEAVEEDDVSTISVETEQPEKEAAVNTSASKLREPKEFVGSSDINLINVKTEKPPEVIIEITDNVEKEDITTERSEAVVTTTKADDASTNSVETEQPEKEVEALAVEDVFIPQPDILIVASPDFSTDAPSDDTIDDHSENVEGKVTATENTAAVVTEAVVANAATSLKPEQPVQDVANGLIVDPTVGVTLPAVPLETTEAPTG